MERFGGQNVQIFRCRFEDCVMELSDLPGYPKYPDAPPSPDPWAEPSERKEGP